MNFGQIMDTIKNTYKDIFHFLHCVIKLEDTESFPDSFKCKIPASISLDYLGLGEIKEVESYSEKEEMGIYQKVYYFPKHDVYIKLTGRYNLLRELIFENEWECFCEVIPEKEGFRFKKLSKNNFDMVREAVITDFINGIPKLDRNLVHVESKLLDYDSEEKWVKMRHIYEEKLTENISNYWELVLKESSVGEKVSLKKVTKKRITIYE